MTDLAVEPTVTTGPIAGSQKVYRDMEVSPDGPNAKVPFRRVNLSNGEHLDLYDTSGPYTDPDVVIDVTAGLPPAFPTLQWHSDTFDLPGVPIRMMLGAQRIAGTEPHVVQGLIRMPLQRLRFAERHQTAECAFAVGRGGVEQHARHLRLILAGADDILHSLKTSAFS